MLYFKKDWRGTGGSFFKIPLLFLRNVILQRISQNKKFIVQANFHRNSKPIIWHPSMSSMNTFHIID